MASSAVLNVSPADSNLLLAWGPLFDPARNVMEVQLGKCLPISPFEVFQ